MGSTCEPWLYPRKKNPLFYFGWKHRWFLDYSCRRECLVSNRSAPVEESAGGEASSRQRWWLAGAGKDAGGRSSPWRHEGGSAASWGTTDRGRRRSRRRVAGWPGASQGSQVQCCISHSFVAPVSHSAGRGGSCQTESERIRTKPGSASMP